MSKRTELEQEPCFILHRRFYADDSVLLDCLTSNYGRISVLARGARRANSVFGQSLVPFQPLFFGASGAGLLRLTSVEHVRIFPFLTGSRLWIALYLNELIMRLFPKEDNCHDMFTLYCNTLEELIYEKSTFFDSILRRFEIAFLDILGYTIDLRSVDNSNNEIVPDNLYEYVVGSGFSRCGKDISRGVVMSGKAIIDLSNGIVSADNACEVRRLMRYVIDYHLDGYTLKTRSILQVLSKR
ncbi:MULTISPECIES: DNA repair protein RecO [Candidatus Ichthyocystis]|uniref:DNA repair protein RecO n=1 Tax=Candidatus Ichthyocystis TaxID=2929841 RepID=UPI000B85076E|nr:MULTISPECIES: DNA repair protein RecO [Ichthyocystis]